MRLIVSLVNRLLSHKDRGSISFSSASYPKGRRRVQTQNMPLLRYCERHALFMRYRAHWLTEQSQKVNLPANCINLGWFTVETTLAQFALAT